MRLSEIREDQRVTLGGPAGHPLHGHGGVVVRVFSVEELWLLEPMTMLGDPFAWPDGQVLVSLDEPRPYWPRTKPIRWTPVVSVRPDDIERIGP